MSLSGTFEEIAMRLQTPVLMRLVGRKVLRRHKAPDEKLESNFSFRHLDHNRFQESRAWLRHLLKTAIGGYISTFFLLTGCSRQGIYDPVLSFRYDKLDFPESIPNFENIEIRIRRSGPEGQERVDYIDLVRNGSELRIGVVNPPVYQLAHKEKGQITRELSDCHAIAISNQTSDSLDVGSSKGWILAPVSATNKMKSIR